MKPHLTGTVVSLRARSERRTVGNVASQPHTAFNKSRRPQPPSSVPPPRLELASVRVKTHTLVLTGALHHRSAPTLEAEIERLCEEGVTAITLDLRELSNIDSNGVAVIAFRSNLCKRRGYDFSVIPGSPVIHRALEQGGVSDLVAAEAEGAAS
jgi:anti-anti-sigma factor